MGKDLTSILGPATNPKQVGIDTHDAAAVEEVAAVAFPEHAPVEASWFAEREKIDFNVLSLAGLFLDLDGRARRGHSRSFTTIRSSKNRCAAWCRRTSATRSSVSLRSRDS